MSHRRQDAGFSRRALLATLGGGVALAPFVPLLEGRGQSVTYPRRLVIIYTPHGTVYDKWKPMGTETSFTLGPILQPLSPHQSKLVVLDGLKITHSRVTAPAHTEGMCLVWTGSNLTDGTAFHEQQYFLDWVDGPSVDQYVAQGLASPTKYRSIELGVRAGGNSPVSRMIFSGPKQPVQPEIDPWRAYDRLFGGFTPPAGAPPMIDPVSARRARVLDVVKGQLGRLQPKIGASDRAKIDAHLTAVRDLGKLLTTLPVVAMPAMCTKPTLPAPVPIWEAPGSPQLLTAQLDLMASVLACDLTRVMSLEYRYGDNDDDVYTWLGLTNGHHTTSHLGDSDADAQASLTKIYTWYAERIAYFLSKLASIPEGNGTVLDNTLVVWGSEIGKGNTHSFEKIPFVLAGGAAGNLRTGRYLQYQNVEHNRLLVSICQLMGLPNVQTFGSTDAGTGPLPGLV